MLTNAQKRKILDIVIDAIVEHFNSSNFDENILDELDNFSFYDDIIVQLMSTKDAEAPNEEDAARDILDSYAQMCITEIESKLCDVCELNLRKMTLPEEAK